MIRAGTWIGGSICSLRATIDSNVIAEYNYDPWGGELDAPLPGSRRSFNDREEDAESGDKNLGVRQYSSEDGRFYAIDPLWEKFPSQSPYVYANNNPLGYTDPEGMQAKETGVVESFLHGFFVGGPTLLLNAAAEQGKYLACPPCAWYNQGKDALAVANDPSILSAKLDAVQQHFSTPNAWAEFGGTFAFNVAVTGGLGAAFGRGSAGAAASLGPTGLMGMADDHIALGIRAEGLAKSASGIGARHLLHDPDWMASLQQRLPILVQNLLSSWTVSPVQAHTLN